MKQGSLFCFVCQTTVLHAALLVFFEALDEQGCTDLV